MIEIWAACRIRSRTGEVSAVGDGGQPGPGLEVLQVDRDQHGGVVPVCTGVIPSPPCRPILKPRRRDRSCSFDPSSPSGSAPASTCLHAVSSWSGSSARAWFASSASHCARSAGPTLARSSRVASKLARSSSTAANPSRISPSTPRSGPQSLVPVPVCRRRLGLTKITLIVGTDSSGLLSSREEICVNYIR